MGEPKFFKEKEVNEMLKTLRVELIEDISETAGKQMYEEFFQIGLLLVALFCDLEAHPRFEKDYFPEMEDGYAKKVAQASLEVAKRVLKGEIS